MTKCKILLSTMYGCITLLSTMYGCITLLSTMYGCITQTIIYVILTMYVILDYKWLESK